MKILKKTISFRILASISTLLIAWGITGNPVTGITVSAIQAGANTAIFYAHEKAWEDNDIKHEIRKLKIEVNEEKMPEEYKKHPPMW